MSRFAIRSTQITHQNIDGEVIAIHFDTGIYYSMTGAAAHVWARLVEGASADVLLASFTNRPADAGAALDDFLEQLVREGLVEKGDGSPSGDAAAEPIPWDVPRFDKFTDISDLIMADPIHDVDEMGWPNMVDDVGGSKA